MATSTPVGRAPSATLNPSRSILAAPRRYATWVFSGKLLMESRSRFRSRIMLRDPGPPSTAPPGYPTPKYQHFDPRSLLSKTLRPPPTLTNLPHGLGPARPFGRLIGTIPTLAKVTTTTTPEAKKSVIPVLTHTDEIFEWVKTVKTYVTINTNMTEIREEEGWRQNIQASISTKFDKDPFLHHFHQALEAYVPPTTVIKVMVAMTKPPQEDTALIRAIYTAHRDSATTPQDITREERIYYRPIQVHEIFEDFIKNVWLDVVKRNHYFDTLQNLRFTLPPLTGGHIKGQIALSNHLIQVERLIQLGQIDKNTALSMTHRTFGDYPGLYEACQMSDDLTAAFTNINKKLNLYYIPGATHPNSIMSIPANPNPSPSLAQGPPSNPSPGPRVVYTDRRRPVIRYVNALGPRQAASPYHRGPPPRPINRGYAGQREVPTHQNRAHDVRQARPWPERRDNGPRQQKEERYTTDPSNRLCYWCAKLGHTQAACVHKQRGRPQSFPPCPRGTPWRDHVEKLMRQARHRN